MSKKWAQTVNTNLNVNKISQVLQYSSFSSGHHGGKKHKNRSSNRYCLLVVLHTQSTSTKPLREQTTRNTYFQVVKLIKATKTISYS